ncbi:glycosyl transferase family 1, partial [Alistipes onderdonkii]
VELRNQMGVRSNQNLRENYSMEIFEKRYLDLIEGK